MALGVELNWMELPQLPLVSGEWKQVGLAGQIAGVHNDVLIVAGGANFPVITKTATRGGPKIYWMEPQGNSMPRPKKSLIVFRWMLTC